MKKFYLLILLAFVTTFVGAQTMNYMTVDSVRVRPSNPTPTDSVFLHVYWNSPWGCSMNGTPNVTNAGLNHSVTFCYTVGMITVVSMDHDSGFIFQGPAGSHAVMWQIFQNATFNTQCDWVRDGGQQVLNILPTDITEPETIVPVKFVDGELLISSNGTLTVYNAIGQTVYNARVTDGERVPFTSEETQIFTAVFRNDSGEVSVLKFISH